MNDCRTCKHMGNNAEDRCRGCWKGGVWRRWEATEEESPWIPVTERLPDKSVGDCSGEVLVNGDGIIVIGWYDYADKEWSAEDYFRLNNVVAWMPLPEPYKPKEETP